MLSEKNSEKVAVYVALIASILALIITIVNYFAPSGTLFAGASAPAPVRRPGGGGGGRMMRGAAGTPEYLRTCEEQIKLFDQLRQLTAEACRAGSVSVDDVYQIQLEQDKLRLNLMRQKSGRRAFSSFAEAYLTWMNADRSVQAAEARCKAGRDTTKSVVAAQIRRNEAALRLMQLERRLDPEKVAEAKAAVAGYPEKLSDEQLEKLLAAEQRSFGPR